MDWTANIGVHESASPAFLRDRIVSALRAGRIHPYLLYSGARQAGLWVALHQAFSPSKTDDTCTNMYEAAFGRALNGVRGNVAHVVSLACGDGTKDLACLEQIRASHRAVLYSPVDISLEMVLSAYRAGGEAIPGLQATPLVCDLIHCSVLPAILKGFDPSGAERLLLFLGTIHNYWPPEILRSVLYPLRSQDQLLIGANLVPEENYDILLQDVLPQYDNEPTRRWLMGGLSELGLSEREGHLRFEIGETKVADLKRIDALFRLEHSHTVRLFETDVLLKAGQDLAVFYSHRFTLKNLAGFLTGAGLKITESWIGASGYEGLFLCGRDAG